MSKSAVFCEHANENPAVCPCPPDCYCKDHTCKDRPKQRPTKGLIIALSGVAGSGKDTAADFLIENRNYVRVALADPLKRIARDVYDFTNDQLWGYSQKRNEPDKRYPRQHGPWVDNKCVCCGVPNEEDILWVPCFLTPRWALQSLGTEWGRHNYPNTWVDLCLRTAQKIIANPGGNPTHYTPQEGIRSRYVSDPECWGVVISDVRFQNEIDAIKKAHGLVVRIARPGAGLKGPSGLHQSELEQLSIPDSTFHAVIKNDSTLEELKQRVIDQAAVFEGERGLPSFSRLLDDDEFEEY